MGQAAAPIAAISSIASVGLSAQAQRTQAAGTQASDEYQAQILDRAAQYGEVQATQTSATLTQQLNNTLDNIDVMRAAGHDDPSSPTGAAVRNYQETIGEGQIGTQVGNIRAQTEQDEASASYLRQAGAYALGIGDTNAMATLLKGFGTAAGQTSGFSMPSFNPFPSNVGG